MPGEEVVEVLPHGKSWVEIHTGVHHVNVYTPSWRSTGIIKLARDGRILVPELIPSAHASQVPWRTGSRNPFESCNPKGICSSTVLSGGRRCNPILRDVLDIGIRLDGFELFVVQDR